MIVFDLDNTLRDVSNADHLIPSDRTRQENWIEWQKYVNYNSLPIKDMVDVYKEKIATGRDVVIVTSSSFGTYGWLNDHEIPTPYDIHEREVGDNRSALDLKKQWIDGNQSRIELLVDDDIDVCDYAESESINVMRVGQESKGALDNQVGGSHYQKYKYQPMEISIANNLDALQHTMLKYVMRHKDKNGVEDLKKVIHTAQLAAKIQYNEDI